MRKRSPVSALAVATCLPGTLQSANATELSCTHIEAPEGRAAYDPYFVFFDSDSVALTPETFRILENVAATYRPLVHCRLIVAAHTDRVGTEAYNLALSERRARAIVAHLRERGVRSVAHIESFGEERPLVETGDEVAEPQNRRAEIVIAPPDRP